MVSTDNSRVGLVTTLDLVGTHEIAEILGVSRQRVDVLARSSASFPSPAATIAAGRIWLRKEVEDWASATGRLSRPEPRRSRRHRGLSSHAG